MNVISRNNWLLILQGWSILWIVLGNTFFDQSGANPGWATILLRTAYTFHLPLLMFTFGCVFYKKFLLQENEEKSGENLGDHIIGLLVPFLLFTVLAVVAKNLLTDNSHGISILVSDLLRSLLYPGLQPMSPMWFILVLIFYYLILPIWKLTLEKNLQTWSVAIILLILHLFTIPVDLLCIRWICYFAIYFYAGMIVIKKGWLDNLSGMKGFYVFLIGYVIYLIGLDTDKTMAEFGGITFSTGLVLILNNSFPKTFFSFRDYYFQIFLMGYFVQSLFRVFYVHFRMPYLLGYLICLALGIFAPVIITKIIHSWKLTSLYYYIGLSINTNHPAIYNHNKIAVEL